MGELFSDRRVALLEACGAFRFLTSAQMVRLGLGPSPDALYRDLGQLVRTRRLGALDCGVLPGVGRLHRLHYLTRAGAAVLAEAGRGDVPFRDGVVAFARDYFHRVACVDVHVAAHLWAELTGARLVWWKTYFDNAGEGRFRPATKIAPDGPVPDALAWIDGADRVPRLLAVEVVNSGDAGDVAKKAAGYLPALEAGSLEDAVGYPAPGVVRVLFVCTAGPLVAAASAKVAAAAGARARQFRVRTLGDVARDFGGGWL